MHSICGNCHKALLKVKGRGSRFPPLDGGGGTGEQATGKACETTDTAIVNLESVHCCKYFS